MKKIALLFLMFLPLIGYCQTETEKYYIYNIVSFEGEFTKEKFKVYYDDGKEVKRLRNDKDNKVRFSTPAGALMYFFSQGWEMYLNGSTTSGFRRMEQVARLQVLIGFCVSPAPKKNLKKQ